MSNLSASKAFKSIDQDIITSGDFTRSRRQITKYKSIEKAITDGFYLKNEKWNTTRVGLTKIKCLSLPDCEINVSNCNLPDVDLEKKGNRNVLISTRNYEDLLDLHKGKKFANPVLNGTTNAVLDVNCQNVAQETRRLHNRVASLLESGQKTRVSPPLQRDDPAEFRALY